MSKKNTPLNSQGISKSQITKAIGGRTNPQPIVPVFKKPPITKNK